MPHYFNTRYYENFDVPRPSRDSQPAPDRGSISGKEANGSENPAGASDTPSRRNAAQNAPSGTPNAQNENLNAPYGQMPDTSFRQNDLPGAEINAGENRSPAPRAERPVENSIGTAAHAELNESENRNAMPRAENFAEDGMRSAAHMESNADRNGNAMPHTDNSAENRMGTAAGAGADMDENRNTRMRTESYTDENMRSAQRTEAYPGGNRRSPSSLESTAEENMQSMPPSQTPMQENRNTNSGQGAAAAKENVSPEPVPAEPANPGELVYDVSSEEFAPEDSKGEISVQALTARGTRPVPEAAVIIYKNREGTNKVVSFYLTDEDGRTPNIPVPAPSKADSQSPSDTLPFADYNIAVRHPMYYTAMIDNVQVFGGELSIQTVEMIPLPEFVNELDTTKTVIIPRQNL